MMDVHEDNDAINEKITTQNCPLQVCLDPRKTATTLALKGKNNLHYLYFQ